MGLFDKWKKKTQDEQLAAAGTAVVQQDETPGVVKESKKGKAASKKTKKTETPTGGEAVTPVDEALLGRMATGVNPRDILLRAHITEKAAIQEGKHIYTFIVASYASKPMVAEAVYRMFGYKPVSIAILKRPGKVVRFGRTMGKRSAQKIARVTMKEGEVLSIHKGV